MKGRRAARGTPLTSGKVVPPEFRPCSAEDYEWAYALKSEAYREVVERQFGPWDEAFQRALFATRWKPAQSRVILLHGEAVGLVAVEDRREELWLDELQVGREWRGRGIGSAIIRGLVGQARAAQKPLRLQVLKQNADAARLYRRFGFQVVAESETHYRMECR